MSLSWQGKGNCGKSVCVEWYFSDLVGQIPHDCCPNQRERVMVSPQSHALPRQTCMFSKHYSQQPDFVFISGILKCFLSSVAHFTSFQIGQKKKPAHSHLSN